MKYYFAGFSLLILMLSGCSVQENEQFSIEDQGLYIWPNQEGCWETAHVLPSIMGLEQKSQADSDYAFESKAILSDGTTGSWKNLYSCQITYGNGSSTSVEYYVDAVKNEDYITLKNTLQSSNEYLEKNNGVEIYEGEYGNISYLGFYDESVENPGSTTSMFSRNYILIGDASIRADDSSILLTVILYNTYHFDGTENLDPLETVEEVIDSVQSAKGY